MFKKKHRLANLLYNFPKRVFLSRMMTLRAYEMSELLLKKAGKPHLT